ncbi:MAG: hypothetical protein HKO13_03640 [Sphingomonas sp.]|nr:hypothetical protein [Sphingomonas sp.]
MTDRNFLVAGEKQFEDRQKIMVDPHSPHAGIVASLRRAFAPVNDTNDDDEFAELLKKLR